MSDKPFDPVTDGTPVQFWQHFANADWQDREALIAARDNAMRRKGMLEAAEIAEARAVEWGGYSALPRIAVNDTAKHIRTAAEKISDPLQPGERCNGKEEA